MRLIDFLDKGASLDAEAPCLTMDGKDLSYGDLQRLSYKVARGLANSGVAAGEKVAILSGNDALAFSCVFGISRAGAVWCPINPRNEATENRFVLDTFDCCFLFFHSAFAPMVERILPDLPKLRLAVCFDQELLYAQSFGNWLADTKDALFECLPTDDIVMIVGTGGTTGLPKGVMLSGRSIEAMTALALMGFPFRGRPNYIALAPLTHAAGVFCFPIMTLGGRIVIMPRPDIGEFLDLIARYRVTHAFLPPTVIYMLLDHPKLTTSDLTSLQCFWYGGAPISSVRLAEAMKKIGPMAQLFGQAEAPMVVSMMSPQDHYNADGTVAVHRLSSAGRVSPLVRVAIMDKEGKLLEVGERGEIVVRGSLVMEGYYKNAEATAEASAYGWHHTGDIGYLDADNFLCIVDRAKDVIITGGFNVYSVEVEQALSAHKSIQDCAVVGLPDDKWGERIVAVLQARPGFEIDTEEVMAFVKQKIGSVKAPKQIEVWSDLPRSRVGKVLKADIRAKLLAH